jgi:hypothetical protein
MNFDFSHKCPKCSGSMYLDKDEHGPYEECLQCGYLLDLEKTDQPSKASISNKTHQPQGLENVVENMVPVAPASITPQKVYKSA